MKNRCEYTQNNVEACAEAASSLLRWRNHDNVTITWQAPRDATVAYEIMIGKGTPCTACLLSFIITFYKKKYIYKFALYLLERFAILENQKSINGLLQQ